MAGLIPGSRTWKKRCQELKRCQKKQSVKSKSKVNGANLSAQSSFTQSSFTDDDNFLQAFTSTFIDDETEEMAMETEFETVQETTAFEDEVEASDEASHMEEEGSQQPQLSGDDEGSEQGCEEYMSGGEPFDSEQEANSDHNEEQNEDDMESMPVSHSELKRLLFFLSNTCNCPFIKVQHCKC